MSNNALEYLKLFMDIKKLRETQKDTEEAIRSRKDRLAMCEIKLLEDLYNENNTEPIVVTYGNDKYSFERKEKVRKILKGQEDRVQEVEEYLEDGGKDGETIVEIANGKEDVSLNSFKMKKLKDPKKRGRRPKENQPEKDVQAVL